MADLEATAAEAQVQEETVEDPLAAFSGDLRSEVEGAKQGILDDKFAHLPEDTRRRLGSAIEELVAETVTRKDVVPEGAIEALDAAISAIDLKLTEQLNLVMHHEDFKKIEGTWRGLHHLCINSETGTDLKINILNVSKQELAKSLKKYSGTRFDQGPLFRKIHTNEFSMPGGEPFGCLIGDYEFDYKAPDVRMLEGLGQLASTSHCPFISAAAPSLMKMRSWQELMSASDLKKLMSGPDYAAWKSLREAEDSRYIALTMPRFLSRLPYGKETEQVEAFAFEEETGGGDHSSYVWSNSAYAMATNIASSFKQFGWCSNIRGKESGGVVEGLPVHTFPTDDGGVDMKCPTEIAIDQRREGELSALGLMGLLHWKNSDQAAFVGAQCLKEPAKLRDPKEQTNENLGCRLPYIFATCRFAHYLKKMVFDKVGSYMERDDMAKWLNDWIMGYVINRDDATQEQKAKYPLRAAKVIVEDVEGNPGYYKATFLLRPHFQLEGLSASLTLTGEVPS